MSKDSANERNANLLQIAECGQSYAKILIYSCPEDKNTLFLFGF